MVVVLVPLLSKGGTIVCSRYLQVVRRTRALYYYYLEQQIQKFDAHFAQTSADPRAGAIDDAVDAQV